MERSFFKKIKNQVNNPWCLKIEQPGSYFRQNFKLSARCYLKHLLNSLMASLFGLAISIGIN